MLNLEAELKREKKKEKSNNGSEWYARYASIIIAPCASAILLA
jgi:hypothetical protein